MDVGDSLGMNSKKRDELLPFPKLSMGQFPTPIRKIRVDRKRYFWMKDDGVCSDVYGGNKVRKLEYLLADLKIKKVRRVVVYGDTDSHNVLATSLFCERFGFEVDAIVFDCQKDLGGEARLSSIHNIKVHRVGNIVCAKNMGSGLRLTCTGKLYSSNEDLTPLFRHPRRARCDV